MRHLLLFRSLVLLALLGVAAAAPAAERTTYFVPDALGSPVAAMDEQGNVLWRESYAPYGERKTKSPDNTARAAYTGKPEDAGTGLVYMGARMYDPESARFTGIDPQGFGEANPQSFGRYLYGNNAPYRFTDPDGEAPTPLDALLIAYDAASFAMALHSGNPAAIAEASMDLRDSLMGAASPIPGGGLVLKAARAGKAADKAASKALVRRDPPNNGSLGGELDFTLLPGAMVDRYGLEGGRFLSPAGTPKEMRALRTDPGDADPSVYKVMLPLDVKVSQVAPAYNQIGLGTQYRTSESVADLRRRGFLSREK